MFNRLKQEFLFIPIMAVLLEVFRHFIILSYPETALFDRGSVMESFLVCLWQITWITSASWLILRIVFPGAYKALCKYYDRFEVFTDEYKQGIAIKLWLTFFFAMVLLLSGRAQTNNVRYKLVDTLNKQLHVRELTGNNDGVDVERYLAFVYQKSGAAWCAAFVSYNLHAVGIGTPPNPKTAWSPAFANPKYIIVKGRDRRAEVRPGDVGTLFYSHLGRVGHVFFIVDQSLNYYITIEGNTGFSGTREGSGVHKLKRPKSKIYTVSNYLNGNKT